MNDHDPAVLKAHARSFGRVADAYDRSRPSYPAEAVTWLTGTSPMSVVELGAGTGQLTRTLVQQRHDVLATEPSVDMLGHLQRNVPQARTAVSTAESIPAPSRSVDVVVVAQAFHWFDHAKALPEIARVLRPGGRLSLVWNQRDAGIPWVRKLDRILGREGDLEQEVSPLEETPLFGFVEQQQYRFWQTLDREGLLDLVRSRSFVALMSEDERTEVLEKVGALYDEYGRGHDGMQLPYLTHCYKATVIHPAPAPPVPRTTLEGRPGTESSSTDRPTAPPEDPGTTLIDFR